MNRFLVAACLAGMAVLVAIQSGSAANSQDLGNPLEVRDFLRGYIEKSPLGPDPTAHYLFTSVPGSDLHLVYLRGSRWCGSGGCTLLFLKGNGAGLSLIGRTPAVNLPIVLLPTFKNGLPQIGVRIRGGGLAEEKEAILAFNGKKYPSSAFSAPVLGESGKDNGRIIMDESAKLMPIFYGEGGQINAVP